MSKMYQLLFIVLISITFSLPGICDNVYAQLTVEITLDPDVDTIYIGSELQNIELTARPNEPNLNFRWDYDGKGELIGESTAVNASYIFYQLPDMVDEESTQTTITVTVSNDAGDKATDSVIFTLINSNILLQKQIQEMSDQRLLKIADEYFEREYWTTPKGMNAFELYKEILERDPNNSHALQKIYEIAENYKSRGDKDYGSLKGPDRAIASSNARRRYQGYLLVMQYLLSFNISEQSLENLRLENLPNEILKKLEGIQNQKIQGKEQFLEILNNIIGEENTITYEALILKHADTGEYSNEQQEMQNIREKLKILENPQSLINEIVADLQLMLPTKLARYIQLKEKERQGADVNVEIIEVIRGIAEALQGSKELDVSHFEQVERLMEQAENYVKLERFTAPPGENAVELYQKMLELEPANRYVRNRLYEIADTYREWEEILVTQGKRDLQAEIYHDQYRFVIELLLQSLDRQFTQTEDRLKQAQKAGDTETEIVQTLKILETLRELKRVYEQFAQNASGTKSFIKSLNETINSHEQQLLGQAVKEEE